MKKDLYNTVIILNQSGILMEKEKTVIPYQRIDFSGFEPGLYVLEFVKISGEKIRIKVIKNK